MIYAAEASPPQPKDFGLLPEGRPFTHYLDNAGKLASHLRYYAETTAVTNGAASIVLALDEEMASFAAIYASRPGSPMDAMQTPGLTELLAAYDTLKRHFDRYGSGTSTPLSEADSSSVLRNSVAAQRRIRQAVRTIGQWPNCQGRPLGSRDAACSTAQVF